MADITLTASSRNALLSLTNTQELLSRTQNRLTSGNKVNSAIDDAVSYFNAKGLNDRASDFTDRKGEIDQGISTLTSAVDGTNTADTILKQLKGIIGSARTADVATRASLTSQFNDLTKQLDSALNDASYQGLNLVSGTSASLTVYFSQGTGASLTVDGTDLRTSAIITALTTSAGAVVSAALANAGFSNATVGGFSELSNAASATAILDAFSSYIDSAVSTVRATASKLGSNVTFLNTRLDFTKNYVNTLQTGSGKLTLADLNTEGANLVALQTRQQIGVQSLSLAGQQQQQILSLMR